MTWIFFITAWIVIQTITRVAYSPKMVRLEGKTEAYLTGRIVGNMLWGILMLGSLYMAGLYD